MAEDYTYAVARIRALETGLLTSAAIEQLISCQDVPECMNILEEKGWGDTESSGDPEAVLAREEEKIWEVVRDLHIDMKAFDVLSLPKEFHNLKAAVKEAALGESPQNIYYDGTKISGSELCGIIKEREFDRLPDNMKSAAEEAFDVLLHTQDGQLCDVIIDKACMEAVRDTGEQAGRHGYKVIKDFAEEQTAICDIRIAARCAMTGKSVDFLMKALADCSSFSAASIAKAAAQGEEPLRDFLLSTDHSEAAGYLAKGPSEFEKWCDDRIMESLQSQKYETFTIGPVIAYVLARQNEIKTVRIVITGKANGLSDDSIRERVRQMYV